MRLPAILTEAIAFLPPRRPQQRPPAPDPVRETATRIYAELKAEGRAYPNWGVLSFRTRMAMMAGPDGRFDHRRPPLCDATLARISAVARELTLDNMEGCIAAHIQRRRPPTGEAW